MNSAKKIAYALVRVSRAEQTTLSQILSLKDIATKFGYIIPDDCVFQEKVSGFDTYEYDRKSIVELKERIESANPKPSAIFCWELSRLTRNSMKVSKYIQELSLAPRIPMYFRDYKIWTIDENGEDNREGIQQLIYGAAGVEKERENTKERTSRGRLNRAEANLYVGHLSDGYIVEEKGGEKKIEVDVERAKIIKDIFDYYLEGKSTNYIAAYLNAQNVPTTNAYRLQHPTKFKGYKSTYSPKNSKVEIERKNSQWDGSAIAHILSNEWYVGIRYYEGCYEIDENGDVILDAEQKPKKKPLSHDPIVTKEVWEQVQRMIGERAIAHNRKPIKNRALLSGLIYCGRCGSKMYSHVTGLNNHYYCSSYERGAKCGLRGVNKENIEACIYELLKFHCFNDTLDGKKNALTDFYQLGVMEKKKIKEEINKNNSIISGLQDSIGTCNKRIAGYAALQADNYEDKNLLEIYTRNINEERAKIREYENSIIHYEARNRRLDARLRSADTINIILRKIRTERNLDVIEELIRVGVERIEVYNADVNCNVIRVRYTNGKLDEFIYAHRLMKVGFIPLNASQGMSFLHYDNQNNVIHSDHYPLWINQKGNVMFDDGRQRTDEEQELLNEVWGTVRQGEDWSAYESTFENKFEEDFSVEAFVRAVRGTSLEWKYERLEGLTELALEQQAKYRDWRKKKYNTGRPTQIPWVLRDADYDVICAERKKIYNKIYKIKNRKNLSEDEKRRLVESLKERLTLLAAQVKHLPKENEA